MKFIYFDAILYFLSNIKIENADMNDSHIWWAMLESPLLINLNISMLE